MGSLEFRRAVAAWAQRRFGVALDPASEISSTIGSKEAVFNFHEGVVDPGDIVLCPSPGYPPYSRGTLFAEGRPYQLPLSSGNGFRVDFASIPEKVARRAKVLWLNYPNSPSGAVVDEAFYREALAFAQPRGIIVASDEAYSEIYYGAPPLSCLNVAKEGVLVFQSLSKRSAMTGYRIGWVMGDPELVAISARPRPTSTRAPPPFAGCRRGRPRGGGARRGLPPGIPRQARPALRGPGQGGPADCTPPPPCTSGSACPRG